MELELVSIKESSQGCRGNGRQEWWYCLIIQIGYDYHGAGVPHSRGRASGHCDHKQGESLRAPRRGTLFSAELKLILDFLF